VQEVKEYVDELGALARQLNAFASGLKTVRAEQSSKKSAVREASAEYIVASSDELPLPLFSENDLHLLGS
jgi:hypothetical protein